MKKIAATFAFLSLLLVSSNAQTDYRFGFEVSPTVSWLRTDDNTIEGNGANLGLRLGVNGESYFAENYAFTFGLRFAFNQGGTLNHENGGDLWPTDALSDDVYRDLPADVNLKYGVQYVEIPLGFKMRTNDFGYIKAYAELPQFILGIRTQGRGAIEADLVNDTEKENIKDVVHPIVLSWGLGGGAEYTINENTSIIAGLYFQSGITDMTRNKGTSKIVDTSTASVTTEDENSKATLGSITLRLGVIF
ncbi:MAG: porin family protein [Saprospiraceae bacterium]